MLRHIALMLSLNGHFRSLTGTARPIPVQPASRALTSLKLSGTRLERSVVVSPSALKHVWTLPIRTLLSFLCLSNCCSSFWSGLAQLVRCRLPLQCWWQQGWRPSLRLRRPLSQRCHALHARSDSTCLERTGHHCELPHAQVEEWSQQGGAV